MNSICSKVALGVTHIQNVISFFEAEGSDGGIEKSEAAIILFLFEEDDLYISIIKATHNNNLVIDYSDRNKGGKLLIVEANRARLYLIRIR